MSSRCCVLGITFLLLGLPLQLRGASPASRQLTDGEMAISVYVEDQGLASTGERKLILAIWGDGYIVWSEDRLNGGEPFHVGRIAPKRVVDLLSSLDRNGIFTEEGFRWRYTAPESTFTVIQIDFKGKHATLESWHELVESTGKAVVTETGTTGLRGRQLFDVLKTEPAEYLLFRAIWNGIRARTAELVPTRGTSISGKIVPEQGSLFWREDSGKGVGKSERKP